MNTTNLSRIIRAAILFAALSFNVANAAPLGTAFTYQGQLQDAGQPVSGVYDFQFNLYADAIGGLPLTVPLSRKSVGVNNGLFNVTLDFGDGLFTRQARWLDISVRTNGAVVFSRLAPRQELTPAPQALHAADAETAATVTGPVAASQLTGTIAPANIANGTITAGMLAPGAINHLDAPDASPANALTVDTNGLVGIGTSTPAAGLQVTTGTSTLAPALLAEVVDGTGNYTNLAAYLTLAIWSNLVAIGSSSDSAVTLMDISNPSGPLFSSSVKEGSGSFTNLQGVSGVALSSNLLAVAASSENAVTLVDVSNPSSPVWRARLIDGVSSFNEIANPNGVLLMGNLLAIAAYSDSAVTLVDVSNPANPILRGLMKDGFNGFTNLGGAYALARQGNLLAIGANSDGAVTLADISDPSSPVLLASLKDGSGGYTNLANVRSVAMANNLLAIASANGITLVDVTSPANPVLRVSLKDGEGGFEGLQAPYSLQFQGTTLWVAANSSQAVTAIDVSNPALPILRSVLRNGVRRFSRLGYPNSVVVSGSNVVVGANNAVTVFSGVTTASAGVVAQNWVGIGTVTPLAALHVKGDVIAETGSFSIEGNGAVIHTGTVGRFGAAAGWKPNTNATTESGVWIEGGTLEGGGFYADGDMAAIWSPGDADILRVYDEDDLGGGPRFVINPSGYVGVLTNNPRTALHVAGVVTATGVKFPDGSFQSTAPSPAPGFYSISSSGNSPATTNRFLAPTVTITITNSSQKVLVTSFKALGSLNAAGASGLTLYIGYRLAGSTAAPTTAGFGMQNLRVPANTRVPMGLTYVLTGLSPGLYDVGLVGSSSDAANWNYNEWGSTTAIEL